MRSSFFCVVVVIVWMNNDEPGKVISQNCTATHKLCDDGMESKKCDWKI